MGLEGISENTNVFLSTTPTTLHPSVIMLIYSTWSLFGQQPTLASTPPRSNVKTYLENKRGVNMCKRAYFDANAHSANRSRNILITLSCWDQHPANCIIDVEFDQHFSPIFWINHNLLRGSLGQMRMISVCMLSRAERKHIFWQRIFWFWLRNCIQASEISCLLCLLFERPSRFFHSQRI